jgi:hypothetical protein
MQNGPTYMHASLHVRQDWANLTSWVDDGVVEPTGNQVLLSLALPLRQKHKYIAITLSTHPGHTIPWMNPTCKGVANNACMLINEAL